MLLPLVLAILRREESTFDRLDRTFDNVTPETASRLGALPSWESAEQVLACLPGRRIEGALLPIDTRAHWAFAGLASIIASAAFVWAFRARGDDLVRCAQVGLFTATLGIAGLHATFTVSGWANEARPSEGFWSVVVSCLGSVESAYRVAHDDTLSFLARWVGYIGSVGLCEEVCKVTPLVLLARGPTVATDRRTWLLYGIASGLGFGLAEAVSYAGHSYNGFATAQTYVLRYVSCVALHAALCASVAVALQARLGWLTASWWSGRPALALVIALAWPIVAHALYDVLLQVRQPALALATAVACVGWLALQLELRPIEPALT